MNHDFVFILKMSKMLEKKTSANMKPNPNPQFFFPNFCKSTFGQQLNNKQG